MVNEQIEIGIFVSLPGLLGTLAFGPLLLTIFYSQEFLEGATLLPWFVLGIYLRVLSWPMGFTILAKGANLWYLVSQTIHTSLHILLVWLLINDLGLISGGVGFFVPYLPTLILSLYIGNRLTGFQSSASVIKLTILSGCLIATGFGCSLLLPMVANMAVGTVLTELARIGWRKLNIGQRLAVIKKCAGLGFRSPQLRWMFPRLLPYWIFRKTQRPKYKLFARR